MDEVIVYLVGEQPPSGMYLLEAPRGASGWWPTDVYYRSSPVIMVLALCNLGREHWRNAVELRAVATRAPPR